MRRGLVSFTHGVVFVIVDVLEDWVSPGRHRVLTLLMLGSRGRRLM